RCVKAGTRVHAWLLRLVLRVSTPSHTGGAPFGQRTRVGASIPNHPLGSYVPGGNRQDDRRPPFTTQVEALGVRIEKSMRGRGLGHDQDMRPSKPLAERPHQRLPAWLGPKRAFVLGSVCTTLACTTQPDGQSEAT